MTEPEQRLALAKWCGWTHIEDRSEPLMMANGTYVYGYPPEGAIVGKKKELPNYTHDLNAMHEAEMKLNVNKLSAYADALDKLCVPTHICPLTHWQSIVMADAAQRCEALLRTLGLWTT